MYYKKINWLFLSVFFLFYSYLFSQEKEIAIALNTDSIYGTLLKSKSKYLCIIHPGSGPTDRNGNNEYGGENYCLKKLADSLYVRGVSSFRYDKRGVGKSKDAMVSEDSLRIHDYVNDLNKIIKFFTQPPYSYKNFVLIGHSEGALIVTLAAQKNNNVKKIILLSGAGYRADTLLKRQLNFLADNAKKIVFSMIDTLASGKRIDNVPPVLSMLFRESVQNYMISWLPIDPAKELSLVKQKVLIIQGDNDIQVGVSDAERLKAFKKDADMKIINNMNHILVDSPKDKKANRETYNNLELPLSKELVPTIIQFLAK